MIATNEISANVKLMLALIFFMKYYSMDCFEDSYQ